MLLINLYLFTLLDFSLSKWPNNYHNIIRLIFIERSTISKIVPSATKCLTSRILPVPIDVRQKFQTIGYETYRFPINLRTVHECTPINLKLRFIELWFINWYFSKIANIIEKKRTERERSTGQIYLKISTADR